MNLSKFFISLLLSVIILSCNSEKQTVEIIIEPPEDNTARITVLSGDKQTGNSGEFLTNPVRVQLLNSQGNPIDNPIIVCTIIEGSGEFAPEGLMFDEEGIAEIEWRIGENYNAMKIELNDNYYEADPVYVFATTQNPQGINETTSLQSLQQLGERFYRMSFYGDFSQYFDIANRRFGIHNSQDQVVETVEYHCSLFSAYGNPDASFFGRSFDNPTGWECLTLAMEYCPTGKYRSLSFMRLQDIGFNIGTDLTALSRLEKQRLFEALYHCPDGINEHGVVAGLANVNSQSINTDMSKTSIWITILVREILDNARNTEEAISISQQYNVCCPDINTLGIHILVADRNGHSAILEMDDGKLTAIPNSESWQVITNSPAHHRTIDQQKAQCPRFNAIYNRLENTSGNVTKQNVFDILSTIGWTSTEWSAVYNMTNTTVDIAIDYNFDNIYEISFSE